MSMGPEAMEDICRRIGVVEVPQDIQEQYATLKRLYGQAPTPEMLVVMLWAMGYKAARNFKAGGEVRTGTMRRGDIVYVRGLSGQWEEAEYISEVGAGTVGVLYPGSDAVMEVNRKDVRLEVPDDETPADPGQYEVEPGDEVTVMFNGTRGGGEVLRVRKNGDLQVRIHGDNRDYRVVPLAEILGVVKAVK